MMDIKKALEIYSSEFSLDWEQYNYDTGRLLLNINGVRYRAFAVPVKDFQKFKFLLYKNKGNALKFLKENFTIERLPEELDERPSDEAFDKFIKHLEGLVP
jgi:hypothetical protein